jgi:hypothetical protein
METCKCIRCNKIITISNKINHENTEFHINNAELIECICCRRVKSKYNFYNDGVKCKNCLKDPIKLQEKPPENKICALCKLTLTIEKFHEDQLSPIGIKSYCKECGNKYKREKVKFDFFNTIHTRNSYYYHLKESSKTKNISP